MTEVYVGTAGLPYMKIAPLMTAANIRRGWKVKDTVAATFDVAKTDPIFSTMYERDLLRLGNTVIIESEDLPTWVGFMSRPEWSLGTGTVKVTAKEAASILKERPTSKEFQVSDDSANVFRRLIAEANLNPTGISASKVPESGGMVTLDLSSAYVYDALNEMCAASGQEWWIEPETIGNSLILTAYLRKWRGEDKSARVMLTDGENGGLLSGTSYAHDDKLLANSVTVVGGASLGGGFALRPSATVSVTGQGLPIQRESLAYDDAQLITVSQSKIDKITPWLTPSTSRDVISIQPTLSDKATVAGQAVSVLDNVYRGPEELTAVVSLPSGRLANVGVGDVIAVQSDELGPDGIAKPFRIMEMSPDESVGTCVLQMIAWES
jgi:hypothetical protein